MRRLALPVVLFATSSLAADARWGLKWKAPDACIGAADLAQVVEQRLGQAIFGSDPQYRVEGTMVEGTSPRWKARMTLVSSAGEVLGTRELTGDDADCRALDGRIALAMSLTIEPQLQRQAPLAQVQPRLVGSSLPKDAAFLHMESDSRDARLLRFGGTAYGTGYGPRGPTTVTITNFIDECRAPCDEVIERADDRFFIGGSGVTMTSEIILADYRQKNGRVDLKVKAGSASGHFLGLFSFMGGLTTAVLGVTFAAIGSASAGSSSADCRAYGIGCSSSFGSGFVIGGIVTTVVGVALTAIGIPVWLNNRTTVTFDDGTVLQ
jgi:hypothetical protein